MIIKKLNALVPNDCAYQRTSTTRFTKTNRTLHRTTICRNRVAEYYKVAQKDVSNSLPQSVHIKLTQVSASLVNHS